MVSDEKVIAALLSSSNIRKASKVCGLSESAVYARMKKTHFMEKYNREKTQLIEQSCNILIRHISSAASTLGYLAESAQSEQTRLNAAESVIRLSIKLNEEVDILRRLEALEHAQETVNHAEDK